MKRYIIRKYIMAKSAKDAINKDKAASVDDVWVDERWLEAQKEQIIQGFTHEER